MKTTTLSTPKTIRTYGQENRNISAFLNGRQFVREYKTVICTSSIEVHCYDRALIKDINDSNGTAGELAIVEQFPGHEPDVLESYQVKFDRVFNYGLGDQNMKVYVYKFL